MSEEFGPRQVAPRPLRRWASQTIGLLLTRPWYFVLPGALLVGMGHSLSFIVASGTWFMLFALGLFLAVPVLGAGFILARLGFYRLPALSLFRYGRMAAYGVGLMFCANAMGQIGALGGAFFVSGSPPVNTGITLLSVIQLGMGILFLGNGVLVFAIATLAPIRVDFSSASFMAAKALVINRLSGILLALSIMLIAQLTLIIPTLLDGAFILVFMPAMLYVAYRDMFGDEPPRVFSRSSSGLPRLSFDQ